MHYEYKQVAGDLHVKFQFVYIPEFNYYRRIDGSYPVGELLIGSDGTILFKHISPLTPRVWQRDFLPLLRQHCGPADCPFLAAVGGR